MSVVDEVRSFNRFYTQQIGLLAEHQPASRLSLPQARVLFEIGRGGAPTAAELTRRLVLDKGYLSRILAALQERGLVRCDISAKHGKKLLLSLTARGRAAFSKLDRGTVAAIEKILAPIDRARRTKLVTAMSEIRGVLDPDNLPVRHIRLRKPVPGDLGWITHRQAVLYNQEYDWDWTYEALVSEVLAQFAAQFDPRREDAWIAEDRGVILGSIFLMRGDDPERAKLRLLYVEPNARGAGLGRRLVDTCVARARELGYRRLTLWTNDVLVSARRIYQAAGFRLIEETPHKSFGQSLVGQTWALELCLRRNA